MAPISTQPKPIKSKDLTSELLKGAMAVNPALLAIYNYVRTLPVYVDDAERDFGLDLYDRMLKDPALISAINAIKVMCLSQGPRFLNRVDAPSPTKKDAQQEALYNKGEEIRTFVESMCDNLQQPIEDILSEMMDFMAYGHKVAEKVYGVDGGKLVLKKLRVKPRESYAFVADQYMEWVGLVANTTGSSLSTAEVSEANIIPRDKFFHLAYASIGGDPRGTSLLRPAYNAWYLKQQTWPNYLKFLLQFATPSIAGILPPDANDSILTDASGNILRDADGNPRTISAGDLMLTQLMTFANGTAIALENGSSIELIKSVGDGSAYIKAIELYDKQMTAAVLIAIRATMESQYGSKADSSTAQDILGSFAQFIQRQVEIGFYRDVILPTVRLNFGEDATQLCPFMSLSDVAREDVVAVGSMIASLANADMIHYSQYPGIDAKLGLPERDYEAQIEEMESQRDASAMLAGRFPATQEENDNYEQDTDDEEDPNGNK